MRRQMDGQSYSAEYEQRQRDPGRGMALAESATLGTVATPIRARGLLKRTYDRFANESLTPQSLRWRQIAADAAALALGAFVAFGCLRRQSRGRAREFIPSHLPEHSSPHRPYSMRNAYRADCVVCHRVDGKICTVRVRAYTIAIWPLPK